MANFDQYFPRLLQEEGGFVDNPDDPGGATNKGITLETFRSYAEPLLGIAPTLENLKQLTDQQAKQIYRREYWDAVDGNRIINQDLAEMICDFYVNAGDNAIRVLQRVINRLKEGRPLQVDGIMGPNTLAAVNSLDAASLYNDYKAARIQYYVELTETDPNLKVFLAGWIDRVNSFPDIA